MTKTPETNQSIEFEPHLRNSQFSIDPSEEKAIKTLSKNIPDEYELVENSVWDEPALFHNSKFDSAEKIGYSSWLKSKIENTTKQKSWFWTLFLIFVSGVWAIFSVFTMFFEGQFFIGILSIIIFGPVLEEILKISAPLLTIEKKPFLFKSQKQIFMCCAFSGLFFAAIENLIYLNVYIKEPTLEIILWRWTVCLFLHCTCASISSLGLIKVWKKTICEFRKPELIYLNKYLYTAIILHSFYNSFAMFLEYKGFFIE